MHPAPPYYPDRVWVRGEHSRSQLQQLFDSLWLGAEAKALVEPHPEKAREAHRDPIWLLMRKNHAQRSVQALQLFTAVCVEEAKALALQPQGKRYDVFLVWHGLVQGRPVDPGQIAHHRCVAEYEIKAMVMEDGEEAARACATAIILAIQRELEGEGTTN